MKMSREGEAEPHKEKDHEEKTEETHPREEEAEKAVTQEFASIASKVTTHFANSCPEPKREDGKIEGRITP